MKIEIDEHRNFVLKEVFSGVSLETDEGHAIGVCMRGDTLEINILKHGENHNNWWRVNMQDETIEPMTLIAEECLTESNSCD